MIGLGHWFRLSPKRVIWHLFAFAAALYLPILILSVVFAYRYVRDEQDSIRTNAMASARSLEGSVKGTLEGLQASVRVLATSAALQTTNLAAFYRRAKQATESTDCWVVLLDKSGQQLLNTRVPLGEPLPITMGTGVDRIFAGETFVSDLRHGAVAQTNIVNVGVPVYVEGQVKYALYIVIPTSVLEDIIRFEASQWQAAILGQDGRIIVRQPRPEFAGTKPNPVVLRELEGIKPGEERIWSDEVVSVENKRLIGGGRRMFNGWTIVIAAGPEVYQQPLHRALLVGGMIAAMCSLLPPILAGMFGMRITGAIARLVYKAEALERGEVIDPPVTPIREVNVAALAMHRAAIKLRAETRYQQLLLQELNHRVKNSLASVQAIARRTFRGIDVERYTRFEGRIMALAATHSLLTDQQWAGADILDIFKTETAPYEGRINVNGPSVMLHSRAAVSLAMVVHELVSNASKYGALSSDMGHVDLIWTATKRNGETELQIDWAETDGPTAYAPHKKGFGTTLIQTSIQHELQGTVEIAYDAAGVKCHISFLVYKEPPMMDASNDTIAGKRAAGRAGH